MIGRLSCGNRTATTAVHRTTVQIHHRCAPPVRAKSRTHPRRRPGTMGTMTPLPAGYRTVEVPQSRHRDLLVLNTWAFPSTGTDDQLEALPMSLTWDRARGVETDEGELVAVHGSYPYQQFPVPGARTAVSGLTWVGVHPAHRRRGLLSSMIDDHFTRSLDRGEAVSALFAAEPAIYGRFGYGLAASDLRMKIPRGAALRDVPGADGLRVRLERLDPDRHGPLMQAVHGRVDRPGWVTRHTPEQLAAYVSDPEYWRDGAESLRIAVVSAVPSAATPAIRSDPAPSRQYSGSDRYAASCSGPCRVTQPGRSTRPCTACMRVPCRSGSRRSSRTRSPSAPGTSRSAAPRGIFIRRSLAASP